MTAFRVQAKRTTNSGPPDELEFGELAYSDADRQFYIGRPAPAPPATFKGDLTDYSAAIAALNAAGNSQADAIGSLFATTSTQGNALAALSNNVQIALGTKANDADLALVAKTGAYADLTGLPTLFSGAYADLTGPPTIPKGFTYDQQTEPVGPAAGATWIERSSGGLIVGRWEWLGSVWAALDTTTLSDSVLNGASPSYPTLSFEAPRCLFVQCRIALISAGNPATPFNATNYRELFLARSNTAVAGSVFSFRPMISLAQSAYVSPMNYLNAAGAMFFTGTTVVGSPGTMHAPSVSWVYREVRA